MYRMLKYKNKSSGTTSEIDFFSFHLIKSSLHHITFLQITSNFWVKELISGFFLKAYQLMSATLQHRPSFSFDRIYLHFFSYSNSARGCLSSDLTAHKLHRPFNHNCLHTILHHTSWLCICILWHPGCEYPSVTSPWLQCSFYNRVLFSAALQRWCWVSRCYPGWLPLTSHYLYVFISRLTEGVPELLQLGWFMTSSCSWSPWPTQLGVRCGLPVSRNLSATWNQSRG